jgi:preprotein translocase subunit YajC
MFFNVVLAADPPTTPEGPPGWVNLVPFLFLGVMLVFMMILPQRRQEKQRQEMISKLKHNDRIVNSGGIIGIVDRVKENEDEIILKGGLRITRSSVAKILAPDDSGKDQKDGGA